MNTKLYAKRDPYEQDSTPNPITGEKWGNYYCRHVGAMTAEGLHSKSDIAMELAHRDIQIDALHKDAERYRWLRAQRWNDGHLAVVRNPKDAIKLGHDSPCMERLDEYIDAAMAGGE